MLRKIYALGFLALILTLTACATIMHGTSQELGISSNPSGAKVTIGNQDFGSTPVIADLKRGKEHIVKIELEGYLPYETTLTKKVSGWVWGNIVFGGLIGLAVDAISGGLYNLTPEQIQAELRAEGMETVLLEDHLYLFVTLSPNEDWTPVGNPLSMN